MRLAAVDVPVPAVIEERYLELPSDFLDRFRDLAGQITAGANTPYEQALAPQNWFRTTFTYDVNVPPATGKQPSTRSSRSAVGTASSSPDVRGLRPLDRVACSCGGRLHARRPGD